MFVEETNQLCQSVKNFKWYYEGILLAQEEMMDRDDGGR